MRDRFMLPIDYRPEKHTFYYTRPCTTLPLLRVDAGEALAFALAGQFFGGALGQLLGSICKKIEPVLGGAVSLGMESLEQALSRPQEQTEQEFPHFLPLLEAILHRTKVQMDYVGPRKVSRQRVIHPLHLAEIDQTWMLFAYDPALGVVRKFLLMRMSNLAPTGDTFEPPKDFNARKRVEESLGRFSGEKAYEVRLALDPFAAFYAREKSWHRSQQLVDRADGRVELTLRVNGLVDANNLALRWGEYVEVLSPPALRSAVRISLESALAPYAERSMGGNDAPSARKTSIPRA